MITIYQIDTEKLRKQYSFGEILTRLPNNVHDRALRYKFEQDAYNFVTGRLLLSKGLEKYGMEYEIEDIVAQENGKPLLDNVHFSISHSANQVVCAITQAGPIGIDIEVKKDIKLTHFSEFFTPEEWTDISNSIDIYDRFYWYWTRKESIIKANGVTLSYLHQINIDPTKSTFEMNDRNWRLQTLDFGKDIYGCLCSEKEECEIRVL